MTDFWRLGAWSAWTIISKKTSYCNLDTANNKNWVVWEPEKDESCGVRAGSSESWKRESCLDWGHNYNTLWNFKLLECKEWMLQLELVQTHIIVVGASF